MKKKGALLGASITGRSPSVLSDGGGMALHIRGSGSLLDLHGSFHNSKHCKLDHTDLVSSEAKSGNVFTKAFVGGVPCDIVDDNLELCDTLTREKVTCRSKAKLVGPMNVTVCVTGRGASEVTKIGRYVDSQDRLYQFLTYAVPTSLPQVSDPVKPPPKKDPPKATEEESNVVILDVKLFYKQQEKEAAEKFKESLAMTEYAKPSSALVCPAVRNGTATFTDLSVSKPGEGYNLTFTITYPSYAPALTTTLEGTFSLTQTSAAMVLQQPSIVQARQPTAITVHFVDKGSGLVLNGLAFKGQTFVGKLLAKTAEGHFEVIQRYAK
ncbi:hypothetical protein O3P69_007820 [Scylla paramamosain]|uniref:Uncharacterized protein n=1 Tax=Scylla paramamosain TaxID=85552 RepID=A0AAW0SGC3_SCYPA